MYLRNGMDVIMSIVVTIEQHRVPVEGRSRKGDRR